MSARKALFNEKLPKPPNWGNWANISAAPLWQVVALACNFDPYDLRGWEKHLSRLPAPDEYLSKYQAALDATVQGKLKLLNLDEPESHFVAFIDYRRWNELHQHLELPDEFPASNEAIAAFRSNPERDAHIVEMYLKDKTRGIYTRLSEQFGLSRQRITAIIKGTLRKTETRSTR